VVSNQLTQRALTEVALLLVAAVGGREGSFPETHPGITELLDTVRPLLDEGTEVAVLLPEEEQEGGSPFSEGVGVWVGLAANGALSLLSVYEDRGVSADLHPDGRLTDEGYSVFIKAPDPGTPSNLSPEAQADAMEIARRLEDRDEEEERRFETKELVRVLPAPWQDPSSVVVTSVELYTEGLIVNYFVPNPTHDEPELELPAEMYRGAGMDPPIREDHYERIQAGGKNPLPDLSVTDDLGTRYFRGGGGGHGDSYVWRGVDEYTPAVPSDARFLVLKTYAGSVEFALPDEDSGAS
jgi:hypothetical protein